MEEYQIALRQFCLRLLINLRSMDTEMGEHYEIYFFPGGKHVQQWASGVREK